MRLQTFRQLVNALPLGLMLVDEAGVVRAISPALAKEWQCDAQQITGKPLADWVAEGDQKLAECLLRFRQSTSPSPARLNIQIPSRPAQVYLLHGSLYQPRSNDEQALILLRFQPKEQGLERFLTLNRKVEELTEEIVHRRRVEEELRSVSDELRVQTEHLIESNHRKDEFLATLAHELRNPLSVVSNNLYLLETFAQDDSKMLRAVSSSRGQIAQLTKLIDDLLDVTRINTGKISINPVPLSVAAVVGRAVEAAFARAEAKEIGICASGDEAVWVMGDAVRLGQVFGNLLDNALKFTPPSGRVEVSWSLDGGEVVIGVKDSGVGIPAHALPHVFNDFYQAEVDIARSSGGLGLGLALVKRLLKLHRGTIEAFSGGAGMGAEFRLRLPVYQESVGTAEVEPATSGTTASAKYRAVLVVDDNADAAESSALLLRLWGSEVILARNGKEALAQCSPAVDAAVLDIGLPDMDGFELAAELRKRFGHQLVLIALSGYGTASDKQRAHEAGFNHHLTKPADLESLKRILC